MTPKETLAAINAVIGALKGAKLALVDEIKREALEGFAKKMARTKEAPRSYKEEEGDAIIGVELRRRAVNLPLTKEEAKLLRAAKGATRKVGVHTVALHPDVVGDSKLLARVRRAVEKVSKGVEEPLVEEKTTRVVVSKDVLDMIAKGAKGKVKIQALLEIGAKVALRTRYLEDDHWKVVRRLHKEGLV